MTSTTAKTDKKQMKSAARLYAVQALFQMEASGQTVESIRREFETHRFGAVYDGDEMAAYRPVSRVGYVHRHLMGRGWS